MLYVGSLIFEYCSRHVYRKIQLWVYIYDIGICGVI